VPQSHPFAHDPGRHRHGTGLVPKRGAASFETRSKGSAPQDEVDRGRSTATAAKKGGTAACDTHGKHHPDRFLLSRSRSMRGARSREMRGIEYVPPSFGRTAIPAALAATSADRCPRPPRSFRHPSPLPA
jgi:hypothetical protein